MKKEEFKMNLIDQLNYNSTNIWYLCLENDVKKKWNNNGYPYKDECRFISKEYSLEIIFKLIDKEFPTPIYEISFNDINLNDLDKETWLKKDLTHYYTHPKIFHERIRVDGDRLIFSVLDVYITQNMDYKFSHKFNTRIKEVVFDTSNNQFNGFSVESMVMEWELMRQTYGGYQDYCFNLQSSNNIMNLCDRLEAQGKVELGHRIRLFHSKAQNIKGDKDHSSMVYLLYYLKELIDDMEPQ